MNSSKVIVIVAASLALFMVGAFAFAYSQQNKGDTSEANSQQTTQRQTTAGTESGDVMLTITFNDKGFDKDTYTVGKDQLVLVKNTSSSTLEFSSDEHPVHTENPELNMRELNPGEEGTFSVSTPGTWKFHDHIDASKAGTLIVTP